MKMFFLFAFWFVSIFITVWSGIDWYYTFHLDKCPVAYSPVIRYPFSPPLFITGLLIFVVVPNIAEYIERKKIVCF